MNTNQIEKNKKFRFLVEESYYEQYTKTFTNIPYIDFYLDGKFESEGNDEVGNFKIYGEFEKNLIRFNKDYIGKHQVLYAGKLKKNKIEMLYFFSNDEFEEVNEMLEKGESNAGIIFNYKAYQTDDQVNKQKTLFIIDAKDNCDEKKSGILFEENGIFEIQILSEDAAGENNIKKMIIGICQKDGTIETKLLEIRENDCSINKFEDHLEE